jgi:hypothetical protein
MGKCGAQSDKNRVVSWLFVFCMDSHQDPTRLCFVQHHNNYRGNVMDKELLDAGYRAYTGEKLMSTSTPGSASIQEIVCAVALSYSI